MALGLPVALRNSRVDLVRAAIDVGAGVATLKVYDGTRPGTGGGLSTQNLLATFNLPVPCGVSAAGVLTFGVIPSATAVRAGTATWFRILDRNGAFVADGNVGTSGADLNFSSVAWLLSSSHQITSLAFTEGNP